MAEPQHDPVVDAYVRGIDLAVEDGRRGEDPRLQPMLDALGALSAG
ncbi:hypothetical protein [Vallicoccus soli]|nr:hypothetical protein [Vallicoccus soli]